MPMLTVEGIGTFEVSADKRLILALTDDVKTDPLHACGGNAKCTTCRVEFVSGEPSAMTEAERNVLSAKGLSGVRLSCQMLCTQDMSVRLLTHFEGSGRVDAGKRPTDAISPTPVWVA